MPLFHVHGLLAGFLAPLFSGGSVIVPSRFSASEFWDNFITHKANWYTAVPTIHQILLRNPVCSTYKIELQTVTLVLNGNRALRGSTILQIFLLLPTRLYHRSVRFQKALADPVNFPSLRQKCLKFVSFGHARPPYLQKTSTNSNKLSMPQY